MSATGSASLLVDAPRPTVHAVLLDALALPAWNPAFLRMTGPSEAGVSESDPFESDPSEGGLAAPYRITVRPGLSGVFTYETVEPGHVRMVWQVPGFAETADWWLHTEGERT
ncbi:hypothetical protein ACFWEJ_20925, partial [Promicromonospora sp. NPDC060204]|uniref:hypothetical protein n=1 Tax=Promicromonospora sp. NPDC060204 TaxID=3347071 RepID=UPI00365D1CA3